MHVHRNKKLFNVTPLSNQRGIAHYVVPLAVVLVVAIAGAYFLVASRAASLTTRIVGKPTYTISAPTGARQPGKKSPNWCGKVRVTYRVQTGGSVSEVRINRIPAGGVSADNPLKLQRQGSTNVWKGTQAFGPVCANGPGKVARVFNAHDYISAQASFGLTKTPAKGVVGKRTVVFK